VLLKKAKQIKWISLLGISSKSKIQPHVPKIQIKIFHKYFSQILFNLELLSFEVTQVECKSAIFRLTLHLTK